MGGVGENIGAAATQMKDGVVDAANKTGEGIAAGAAEVQKAVTGGGAV